MCSPELLLQRGYPAVRTEEGAPLGGISSRWGHGRQKEQSPQQAFLHGSGQDGSGGGTRGWEADGLQSKKYPKILAPRC